MRIDIIFYMKALFENEILISLNLKQIRTNSSDQILQISLYNFEPIVSVRLDI